MGRGMKPWSLLAGGLVVCAATVGAVLTWDGSSGNTPGHSATPSSSSSAVPDLVPNPSTELLAYGKCLTGAGLRVEHAGGVIIVKGDAPGSAVEDAESDCTEEQRAFAKTIEFKGEGSAPKEPAQAEFQVRLGGCVVAQGVTWPAERRVADRSNPVFLESDGRVPAMRNCIAHNMVLPGDGKPKTTASS
ncbi:hypothetical protein ACFYO2_15375 [Streptomyces sp. NPDC006602]|uniref:hypothetical protein n=1 Tax=Streptomyces sp. NPDC006602 TaxID=3364751 RepID=UPI003690E1B3